MNILKQVKKFFTPDNGKTQPLIPKLQGMKAYSASDIVEKYRKKNIKQFPDLGFKLLILDALLEEPHYQKTLGEMLEEHEQKCNERVFSDEEIDYDTWTDADNISIKILDFVVKEAISEKYLEKVTELTYDGGNEIYRLMFDWDGEDGLFDVHSIKGFEKLKNLQKVHLIAGGEEVFEPMKKAGIEIIV